MGNLPDFSIHCEAACRKFWGEPDWSTPKQLRWNGGDTYGQRTFNLQKRCWYDHGAKRGGSTLDLVAFALGWPADVELKREKFFEAWREGNRLEFVPDPAPEKKKKSDDFPPIRDTFPYHDENGELLYEVVRFDTTDPNKRFRQRRPDGKGGWIWDLKGVRRVPYRLPELIAAGEAKQLVLETEGEKDANTAVKLGYAATTMPGGVGKWRPEYDEFFRGADVVVVSDNDPQLKDPKTGKLQVHPDGRPVHPGQDHAAKLAKRLARVAKRVRVIMFEVKDLSDWVAAGGTREQLDAIIAQAPEQPQSEEPEPEPEPEPIDVDPEITRLAKLSLIEYERERKGAAEKLGIRASILEILVKAKRTELGLDADDGKQGRAISYPEREPWPEPVNGAEMLTAMMAAIGSHVVMADHSKVIAALWAVHTYLIDCFWITPRLAVRSPTWRCGKSTLLHALKRLVYRPQSAESVTAATMFRLIESHRPTLLVDEADTFLNGNEDLRNVFDSGYEKDGCALRTIVVGDNHEPRAFSTYAALAIALIGKLPGTVHDRSVVIDLKRRLPSEKIVPLRTNRTGHLDELARKAARWAKDHADEIRDAEPVMPPEIFSREADKLHALLAIADAAGGDWPKRAREAAVAGHNAEEDDDASRMEQLLGDIRTISRGKLSMPSADLVKALVALEGRPWAEMGKARKPLTQNGLARMLKPLKITTENIWLGDGKVAKKYVFKHFEEWFARYLGEGRSPEPLDRYKADETGTSAPFQTARPEGDLADKKCEKSNNDGHSSGIADGATKNGERTAWAAKSKSDDLPYRGPVVAVPDLGPGPLDEHGQPLEAPSSLPAGRHQELAEWCRKWEAEGEPPEELADALRMTLREEVASPEEVEVEFERIMKLVREG